MQRADKTSKRLADTAQEQAAAKYSAAPVGVRDTPRMMAQQQQLDGIHASPRMVAQGLQLRRLFGEAVQLEGATRPQPNRTCLPNGLKAGIESLSGMSLDGFRVHYNSVQPAQFNAHAYAQGSEIHVAPGQEQHLPHEAWHVVQQKQGRLKPTRQMVDGVPVNASGSVEVAQLARIVKRTTEEEDDEEYVVVDVPGDGTCLIHSFNLTSVNQGIVAAALERGAGRVTPQMIEDSAYQTFRARSAQPTLNEAFQATGNASRVGIAQQWTNNTNLYLAGLQGDIQAIIHAFLEPQGLLGRKEEASEKQPQDDLPASSQQATDKPRGPPVVDDFDFAFDAVYFPDRARQENPSSSRSAERLDRAMFAITEDELRAMAIPMGVARDGLLARAICDYVVALAAPHIVGEFLPMHALILPPANNIPQALVLAYIQEFADNTRLWASETALTTLSETKDTQVGLHTFNDQDEHITSNANFPGTQGQVDLYQEGAQTHFQAMFGPFPAGFFEDYGIGQAAREMGGREGVSDEQSPDFSADAFGNDYDDAFGNDYENDFGNDYQEDLDNDYEEESGTYFHPDALALLSREDRRWIENVVDELGEDFDQPADVVQVVYRAAAVLGADAIFSRSPADAAALVNEYKERRANASVKASSSSHESQTRDPIIPLAGLVPELIDCGIPVAEIGRLLPHASAYLAFHDQRPTWKAKHAGPRVQALKAMAAILNEWAEAYEQPQLHRGPSIAEHTTVQSPLAKNEAIGVNMRALLTIDPGNLVGFEPEESQTWKSFRDALQGFVRAHLLNKHVGGSGEPTNIGYLSSNDNTRMSKLGEEYVKTQVIENGKRIFFGVEMPTGRPDLEQSPHFLSPDIASMLVNQVSMRVGEVRPFDNEKGEKDLEFRNVFLRDQLGITDEDVQQSGSGAMTFPTETPSADSLSKIDVNHTKRIKTESGKATNLSLDTFSLPSELQTGVTEAQRQMLKEPTVQERTKILETVRQALTGKVRDDVIAVQLHKLAEVGRQSATLANTEGKKEGKAATNMKKVVRTEFLARYADKLDENQKKQIASMTDTMFERAETLLANGATLREALVRENLRDPKYSVLLANLKKTKQSGGIKRYFTTT